MRQGNESDGERYVTYSQGNSTRGVDRYSDSLGIATKIEEENEEEGDSTALSGRDMRGSGGSGGGSADWSEQDMSGSQFDMTSGGTNFASVGVNYTVSFIIQLYGESEHVM